MPKIMQEIYEVIQQHSSGSKQDVRWQYSSTTVLFILKKIMQITFWMNLDTWEDPLLCFFPHTLYHVGYAIVFSIFTFSTFYFFTQKYKLFAFFSCLYKMFPFMWWSLLWYKTFSFHPLYRASEEATHEEVWSVKRPKGERSGWRQ